jgi:RNA polymerase sigma-70 factor (ECF subfamily)
MRLIVHRRPEALSELYERYVRLVFSLALHSVGDPATAEEITQDVFFNVWEKAHTYRSDQAKVSTWLTSVARYRSIDILRRRGSRPERNSVGWEDVSASGIPVMEDGPEEVATQFHEQRRVREAILSLPGEQQEALALAYFEGLSHSQIAERLGQPLGTVKTRIRLAMQKLRELLSIELPHSG